MHLPVLQVFVIFAALSAVPWTVGGWSGWNAWGSCSVTCGAGFQTRNRTCTNRSPGMDCPRSRSPQLRLCNTKKCPIDGGWGDWNKWSLCTKAIDGIQIRTRECVNPKPRYGGKSCSGSRVVVRECGNTSSCHEEEIPSLGTMEIFKNNTWEKFCTASWDDAEENLTCRAMGYFNNGPIEDITGQNGRNGSNATVHRNCRSMTHDCVNKSKVDLQKCKVPVRLNGANIEHGGRVEVFYGGNWGRICRKDWHLEDVQVVCNQLGFRGALAEFIGSEIKEENIPYLMSKVACSGHESDLAFCKRTDGDYDCVNDKGAQALCEPKNREALEKKTFVSDIGNSETFQCFLQNDTYIQWYVKGQRASSTGGRITASGGTLIIHNVQLTDGGTYECSGLKYARFYTIYVNAIFKDTPKRQTLIRGTIAFIKCSAVGTPIPQFDEWKKDGNKSLDKGRFTKMSNGNLRVYPIRPDDQGNYTCTVKQAKGTKRTTTKYRIIHVSVVVPPNIQVSELNLTVREGDNVSLTCIINEGSPTPKITWHKDGTSKDEKKTVLQLTEVTAEDEGWYTCKAENEGGSSKDSTFVTVDVPPKVNPEMVSQSAEFNSVFTMKCIVGGDPTPKVSWTKNGNKLANISNTLTINHMTFNDTGQYGCSAENRAGKIRTTIWIEVVVSPQVELSLGQENFLEGKTAYIKCKATAGIPKPMLSWSFQSGSLPSGAKACVTENDNTLMLENIKKNMEGPYVCRAKNTANTSEMVATVRILEKPTAEITPKVYNTIVTGDELQLTCKVSNTTSEVKWKKNGSPVTKRASLSRNGDRLVIQNVSSDDSGFYSCEAHNQAGFLSSTAVAIKVRVPPLVNPNLNNQSVLFNSTFTMECFVGGDPPPKVNWTKNGTYLANTNKLTISHVTFKDAGQYGCSAENIAGKISIAIWSEVLVSPQVHVSPRVQTVPEGKTTKITCKAAGVPKPTISWNVKDGSLSSVANVSETDDGSVLQLQNTTKDMEGAYMCTATNKANAAYDTSTLRVLEKPTAEIMHNSYTTILADADLYLTCKVSSTTVEVNWKKNGAPLTGLHGISRNGDKSTLVIENVGIDDGGDYSCEAHNKAGFASSTVEIKVKAVLPSRTRLLWYYIAGPVVAVIVLALGAGFFYRRRILGKANRDVEQGYEMNDLNKNVDKWEVTRQRITLKEVIGSGAFGVVWRAHLNEPEGRRGKEIVAAKCFTPTAGEDGRKALMREIELGKLLNDEKPQPNIIKFIGCVTTQIHPILIMEYLPYGDLLGYMRKSRGIHDKYHVGEGEAVELQTYDLVSFAKQIATGMVYLTSKGVIHRDLAARNVLLDRNFVCKVTDFGMAYQNFKYGHGNAKKGCIPVKWTAPEILFGDPADLSTKSDVWSYGIVLYEIFTIGGIPYPEWSEAQTIAEIKNGYRMPKPEHIDDTLYHQMNRCLEQNPFFRPHFEQLRQKMTSYIEKKMYLELINMSEYDAAKYSKVEDVGAEGKNKKPIPPPRKKCATVRE